MASIEWINHASYLMRLPGIDLVCDPWLEGTAFKDGWRHISSTRFGYERFAGVSHIWISHQHPDHFAPASLKKIAREDRERIVVLYQQTADKLVLNWLRSNGFARAQEVPLRRWIPLDENTEIQVGTVTDDSWLAVRRGGKTYLNVNDCVLKRRDLIESIAEAVGDVDVLFTQFSYAQWIGNPGDTELRRRDAREKYERIRLQNEIFNPRVIVPFASFIYFCHEENFFMNDSVNAVYDVASFIEHELKKTAVVLYPGETWNLEGPEPDWRESARRYGEDFADRIGGGPVAFVNSVAPETALSQMNVLLQRLKAKNPLACALLRGRKATFYVPEIGQGYEVTAEGVRPVPLGERQCDINTSMENVLYAFRTPWGENTLRVNGRFVSYRNGGSRFFRLVQALHHYNVTPVDVGWLRDQIVRVMRAIGRRLRPRPARPRAHAG